MITIQLPDGTFAQKPIDALQPEDMIVFGDTRTTQHVTYRQQPMDWDFDAPSVAESAEGHAERLKERGARESAHPE